MKNVKENLYQEQIEEDEEDEEVSFQESDDIIDLDEVVFNKDYYKNSLDKTSKNLSNKNNTTVKKEDRSSFDLKHESGKQFVRDGSLKNIEGMSKEEIVKMLMSNDLSPMKETKSVKGINSEKSFNVSKNFKTVRNRKEVNLKEDDPEIKNSDFNVAYSKVVQNMINNTNKADHPDIMRLLLSGDNNPEAIKKHAKGFSKDYYVEKVEKFLEKKNRNLEVIFRLIQIIQEKVHEEFNKKYTFNPTYSVEKPSISKRNLEQFLEDQNQHKVRTNEKITQLKEETIKKDLDGMTRPKIDENSKKIIEEKKKEEYSQPAYLRLYNMKKEKDVEKKKIEIINYSKDNEGDKKKSVVLSKSSSNLNKNNIIPFGERSNHLYNDAKKKQEKIDEMRKKQEKEQMRNIYENKAGSNQKSQKVILMKFVKNFRKQIQVIESDIHGDSNLKKLNFLQFSNLMTNLNFISPLKDSNQKTESIISQKEKKMLSDIHEELKDSEGYLNVDDVFIFLISLLNLYEAYLLKMNKDESCFEENKNSDLDENHIKGEKSQSNEKESPEERKKRKKQQNKEKLLNKIRMENALKIKVMRKYGGVDEASNYIISLDKLTHINKDFNLLGLNWRNNEFIGKIEEKKEKALSQVLIPTFKPKINKNSEEMSTVYRKKLTSDPIVSSDLQLQDKLRKANSKDKIPNNAGNDEKSNLNYIDMLVIKKRKQENIFAMRKEEKEMTQMKECTFKPKINSNFNQVDVTKSSDVKDRTKRIEVLYKKGQSNVYNKKDKTTDEYEVEKYHKECTFKPNLEKDKIVTMSSNNPNYNKELEKFNERLKMGRIEREIKDSVHTRGDLKKYDKTQKLKDMPREQAVLHGLISSQKGKYNNETNQRENQMTIDKEKTVSTCKNEEVLRNDADDSLKIKEERIPLLIIDVNVRPGEKKKIYIFEGDTPETLTEKFASENGIEGEVKEKLKHLIQNQMSRLLLKIDEETQSINSAKSFTTNNK